MGGKSVSDFNLLLRKVHRRTPIILFALGFAITNFRLIHGKILQSQLVRLPKNLSAKQYTRHKFAAKLHFGKCNAANLRGQKLHFDCWLLCLFTSFLQITILLQMTILDASTILAQVR